MRVVGREVFCFVGNFCKKYVEMVWCFRGEVKVFGILTVRINGVGNRRISRVLVGLCVYS